MRAMPSAARSQERRPKTVFLLGNGRSGTRFLCGLFRSNVADCLAVHEPYLAAAGRPSMFGSPIYYFTHGMTNERRKAFEKKVNRIRGYQVTWYVETNHAFLKSFADLAIESFPDMKLVHVVRNPLNVCASQVHRELFNHRYHIPFRYYWVAGRKFYRWRLTGDEPIYQHFDNAQLTLFQRFFIQWIEIENRAQRFLETYQKRSDCFVLHTPYDLNDEQKIRALFDSFGMQLRHEKIVLSGTKNFTPGRRQAIDPSLEDEMRFVVQRVPDEYLAIFDRAPYAEWQWSEVLRRRVASASEGLTAQQTHRRPCVSEDTT